MQKGGKMMPKWSQNGCQNRCKIEKVTEKRHAKNDAENWCRKKSIRIALQTNPGSPWARFLVVRGEGGRPETGYASLMPFSFTRSPPRPGCGGCFLIKSRALDATGSTESAILAVFSRSERRTFFWCRFGTSKINKNQQKMIHFQKNRNLTKTFAQAYPRHSWPKWVRRACEKCAREAFQRAK